VKFELEPRGNEVLLSLVHLPVLERFEKQECNATAYVLDMVDAAAGRKAPAAREVYLKQNAEGYAVDLSGLARYSIMTNG
jgi:hypothetical protein